ncbi:MAG: efflux RND transporter periplasmic adaptor subunit [Rhodocyclaceae bacterium]|nr:efflux RND transporter periplasmic adaptor subunit [Rhodocyclaceae bacterium]
MRRTAWVAVVVVVVAAAAAYFLFFRGSGGPGDTEVTASGTTGGASPAAERRAEGRRGRRGGGGNRQVRVVTAEVKMRTIDNRVAAVGTGRALRSLTLSADVSGVIEKVAFTAGKPVKEGEALVILESQAQAIAVKLAQVKVDDAQATVTRYEKLNSTNTVATVQLETARTNLAAAKAELEAKQYELRRRTIRAPFDGVMGITNLVKGDYLKDGAAIATIDDRSKLLLEFVVSERAATSIKLGQQVRATTLSLSGQAFFGTVTAIDSRIDPASRTLRVEGTIPNPDNRLLSGMTFSVSINIPGELRPSFPGLAIKWDRQGAHVWQVMADDTVKRVGVTIRRRDNDTVSVDAKLQAGDKVVIEGLDNLRPGLKVQVAQAARPQ